ncbi:amino acid ABC transporter permease [Thioclava sp. SK-1]|uniref:amino acid ABC transporter permease n=1 Tax=Thioclava sp. SK-1 TaxID=1889770 RepID=UPI000825288D|nr:amino acid ABC transporter permease [Thioclava sp. SK-1]OCX58659.1 amino acid ABC transporter permease [Thioclava sp. SK-1]
MSDMHAETVPYVRDTMLPQSEPPNAQSGAVKWLRENMFSSWTNAILTAIGVAIIYVLFTHFYPWFAHGVWNASSVAECRQIITETYGEGATGACWAVIKARWNQYLFGFYPRELYWRPILTFVLMFVAAAPVLYTSLPRKMLWFTVAYPLLALWLLWGGSIWPVLMIAVGFVIGFVVIRMLETKNMALAVAAGILVPVLFWIYAVGPIDNVLTSVLPIGIEAVPSREFGGFLLAIVIGLGGIVMSLPLGIVLALGRQSDMFLIKTFSVMFIEFIRGVPLITLLFVASLLLNYFLPPGTNFDIILRVMILVTMFSAAYIAEVIRGGLAALPRGQYEAADALGLDYWRAQRLIILPQALKISIPGIVSTFIGMFKDTTLVTFVGLYDPLKSIPDSIRAAFEWKGTYWEHFVFVGAVFFVINFAMSRYSMYLERKLKRDHR